ncbi:hypothetical protein [Streptomyces sp. NPDC058142]|uniref:hypothetical protein n=1 Tax=Streptomyces sp. NPDC058142 TaxID=3346355 RepID=UPI0036E9B59C
MGAPAARAADPPPMADADGSPVVGHTETVALITGDIVDPRVPRRPPSVVAPRPADGTDHPAAIRQDGKSAHVFRQGAA